MARWETWSRPDLRARLTRTPIAILMGGESEEREVSLTSGAAVSVALRDLTGPAFDVTPAHLVTGIITERGVARPPYEETLQALLLGSKAVDA